MSSASSSTLKQEDHDAPPVSTADDALLDQILQVAIDASKKAGDIILGNAGGAEVTERKANSRDLLTLIDPLCEKVCTQKEGIRLIHTLLFVDLHLIDAGTIDGCCIFSHAFLLLSFIQQTIRETVQATFPSHDFLGEEDVPPGKEASSAALDAALVADDDWLWIVDPIDGTTNFVHGMPLCMPSVAATYKGEVMVGVIYDCHRDELFTAVRGRGAYMNGERIHVGKQETIGDAIVAMGSPPAEESMQASMKGVVALMPKVRTIRMLGSAAIMLAWVSNGRLTCYWEYDLSSWDVAAGALLVTEAGGRYTDLAGADFTLRNRKMCASNGKVHDEILRVLQEAGVE